MSATPIVRTIHVGVGRRGTWPLHVLTADPRFQPTALVDIDPSLLAAAREITGLPDRACFTRLEDALAGTAADAVIICTPTVTHGALCRTAFQAGKHVLVEKGMTTSWEDAVDLVRAAETAGVRFCVSQNYRYRPEVVTLRAAITSGTYGTPHLVDLIHHRFRSQPRTLTYPYAMVWDMSVHHFDNLVFCFGPVAEAAAVSFSTPWSLYPEKAGVSAVLQFTSGAICTYELTHIATVNAYLFAVQSERGVLRTTGQAWEWTPVLDYASAKNGPPEPVPPAPAPERSEQGVIDDFYQYIVAGREPGISGRRNLETLRACELVRRAAEERRVVRREEVTS